jgi:hypothetical protein
MSFKVKYFFRNITLDLLYWFFSFTGLTIVYGFIKYMKVIYYHDWMFKNINPFELKSISWLLDHYIRVGSYSIFTVLLISFVADLFLRRVYVRI